MTSRYVSAKRAYNGQRQGAVGAWCVLVVHGVRSGVAAAANNQQSQRSLALLDVWRCILTSTVVWQRRKSALDIPYGLSAVCSRTDKTIKLLAASVLQLRA
ncbi:unnamed protein product [Ceratitis capitata]|uniref:(Mediterranean fruit fly) hypothetical protein n=1 Tax=Ceratitis capitata TaxID=7213 RepID=A0A811UQS6_CERCA|nr:unnamed protein product [Ceratitis capitata]